jgi:signal transduction histidine kinase
VVSWLGRSIRNKLAVTVLAAVLSAMLFAALVTTWRDADQRFESMRAELAGIAQALAASAAPALAAGDHLGIVATLNAAGRIPAITFAQIVDTDGRPVHQVGSGILLSRGDGGEDGQPNGLLAAVRQAAYPLSTPILRGGKQIGTLELIADTSRLRTALHDSLVQASVIGLLAALIGILASSRLQNAIARPIAGLTEAVRAIHRTHDYSQTVQKGSDDETGDLVEAFNGMMAEIRARDRSLRDYTLELERSNRELSEFAFVASHDLQEPLRKIGLFADRLARDHGAALPPEGRMFAERMRASAEHVRKLIDDFVSYSRLSTGPAAFVQVDLAQVLDRVLEELAPSIEEAKARIETGPMPEIEAEPAQMNQLLHQLVGNALKFRRPDIAPVIRIGASVDGGDIVLSVTDNGVGIDTAGKEQMFKLFGRLQHRTDYQGTGMGLAVCRKIVERHGGTIDATGEPDAGSVFTVTLPIARGAATAA